MPRCLSRRYKLAPLQLSKEDKSSTGIDFFFHLSLSHSTRLELDTTLHVVDQKQLESLDTALFQSAVSLPAFLL